MKKNKKGFTLIELMVVIAIIAILATVVLVSLQNARDAAEDSKRKSAVTQIRSIAEIYYATEGQQSYTGFDNKTGDAYDVKDLEHLMSVNATQGGPTITIAATDASYCAAVPLKTDEKKSFCISNLEGPGEYPSTGETNGITCGTTTNTYRCVAP